MFEFEFFWFIFFAKNILIHSGLFACFRSLSLFLSLSPFHFVGEQIGCNNILLLGSVSSLLFFNYKILYIFLLLFLLLILSIYMLIVVICSCYCSCNSLYFTIQLQQQLKTYKLRHTYICVRINFWLNICIKKGKRTKIHTQNKKKKKKFTKRTIKTDFIK